MGYQRRVHGEGTKQPSLSIVQAGNLNISNPPLPRSHYFTSLTNHIPPRWAQYHLHLAPKNSTAPTPKDSPILSPTVPASARNFSTGTSSTSSAPRSSPKIPAHIG